MSYLRSMALFTRITHLNLTILHSSNSETRERESWAHTVVAAELTKYVSKGSHAILIVPQLYRRYIEVELRKASITFENPIEHLAIGQQIKWLAAKTHVKAAES
jgi:hypothetical protein